ncbi:MAG TPA: gamma-glutamyl-gamma-aminobutyrate hydrolase family protein [Chitinophagaceae bacterium]|nr:gamma-glutamyl-gamma-aminobutyrate hydrolase family protein [Chitinophagaceae bacterium]
MIIGLTYTGSREKQDNYLRWLNDSKVVPQGDLEIIEFSTERNNAGEMKKCDALLLSGGVDIEPALYGSSAGYENEPDVFDRERDLFEQVLFAESQYAKKPVLAVCRGMQLVNCILGGTLKQDLGIIGNAAHKAEALTDREHGVNIERDTLLQSIAGERSARVNSAHHQALERIGKGLRVNCLADDGTVEGIEWAHPMDRPFFLGIQWHPERMFRFNLENSPLSASVRDRFMNEIINNNNNR